MEFKIIDFHTHPFMEPKHNICSHTDYVNMTADTTLDVYNKLGIAHICGSVIRSTVQGEDIWQKIKENNDMALRLRDYYRGFYIPGFHVHPAYIEKSVLEIERMHSEGVKLVGELVPYHDMWGELDYASDEFSVILDEIEKYDMIVNFHSMNEDAMDKMVKNHPNVRFVAAHPGEYGEFMRHIERAKLSENYYLDISGYGIFRYGMLKRAICEIGADRILFGSDYPTCNVGMYLGGVLLDDLLSDDEKEKILYENAKKLLCL